MNIKDLIKNNVAYFLEYRAGNLYYGITMWGHPEAIKTPTQALHPYSVGKAYKFPVPISDCGEATFKARDKAIYFMRYIRLAIQDGTLVEI